MTKSKRKGHFKTLYHYGQKFGREWVWDETEKEMKARLWLWSLARRLSSNKKEQFT